MANPNADPSKIPQPKKGDLISLRKFAALMGVQYSAANEALHEQRIQFQPGTRLLDYYKQKAAFEESRTHRIKTLNNDGDDATDSEIPQGMTPLGKAKLRKEVATAKLKELELGALETKYVDKEQVRVAMFKFSRTVRDAVLTIPDRVAPQVGAAIRARLKAILSKETGNDETAAVLKKLSDAEIERLVRVAWVKESSELLETIGKPPTGNDKLA